VFAKHPELIIPQPADSFVETDYVVANHFCLPLYFDLTDDQIEYVVESLDKAARSFNDLKIMSSSIAMVAACPFPANFGTPAAIREMSEELARRGHSIRVVTYPLSHAIPINRR